MQHLADDSVRRDDGHIALNAVVVSLVDVDDARLFAAAGANDLSRHGLAK